MLGKLRFSDGSDFNRMLWIGGCLPLLAVVYMDFLDFGANAEQINYSIPRMSHIRNDNFMLVHNADCNLLSRKSFGVLPLRDISLTPYSVDLAIVPAVLEPNGGNDVVVIQPLAHAPPNEVMDDNVIEDNFMEDIGNHQETIDISDSQVDLTALGLIQWNQKATLALQTLMMILFRADLHMLVSQEVLCF